MEITDLKILVLGIGSIGRRHSEVLYSDLGCRDITLWDPQEERAKEHAAKFPGMKTVKTFEEGLEQKPDAVFVLSPPAWHIRQAAAAVEAGCNVMIEKPLSINREGVQELVKLAKEKNKIISVAYCSRHYESLKRLKEVIDSGKIGKIINIRTTLCEFFPESRPDYMETYYVKYSGCFELVHAVDLAFWLAGGEPEKICGICGSDADIGFESPDNAEILFRTSTGVTCSVNLSFYRFPGKREMGVYGTEGSCELIWSNEDYDLNIYTRETRVWETEHAEGFYRNMVFAAEDKEFLESIVTGVHKGCTVEDAARSLEVYCQVYGDHNEPPKGWK